MYACFWHSIHVLISIFCINSRSYMLHSVGNMYSTLQVSLPHTPFPLCNTHTLCNTTEGNYWLGASNPFQRIALSCVPQWKIHQDNSLITAYPPTRSLQSEMNCLVTYSNAASGKMFDYFIPLSQRKAFLEPIFILFLFLVHTHHL